HRAVFEAAHLRAQRLHAGESGGAIGPGGKIGEARRAFGKGRQHSVAVADGLVAGQAQAAVNVLGRTDDAFFCRSVQGGSRNGLPSSLTNGRAGRAKDAKGKAAGSILTRSRGSGRRIWRESSG